MVSTDKIGLFGKGNRFRVLDNPHFGSIAKASTLVSTFSLLDFFEIFAIIDNSVLKIFISL